ncbi:MAG: cell division protein ZipA C-terminal FtsZ-binding domain-containing protein [Halothiobacillaceae bacterium]
MEWLRWIVLIVGLLVIVGIIWMYRRHRSEQAVDLSGGHTDPGGYHDPIDASVGAQVSQISRGGGERSDEVHRDPQLELDGGGDWSEPDEDGFIDGASAGRVVGRADEPRKIEPAHGVSSEPEPLIEPEPARPEPLATEESPDAPPPQPGFSNLFTRRGQQPAPLTEPELAEAPLEPAGAGVDVDTEESAGESTEEPAAEAVISMLIVDREQSPMPGERVRRAVEAADFEFGEFGIYHFQGFEGESWFSLMNAVSPGHFDPDDLSSFETPALALFMQLPVHAGADASLVFERMHQVASALAESLDAILVDDRRELLDSESVDRYRELIDAHG